MKVSIYRQLGVRPAINAAGTLTRVGGSRMDPEVLAAMTEAAQHHVAMDQLQAAASRRIAQCTGAEAGLVTSGAAAALTLSAAACMAGDDPAKMDRLPDSDGMPHEIVMPRSHRSGYDHALRAAGAKIIEVGLAERSRDPQPWEIDAAINERTAAVAYAEGFSDLALEEVIRVAHARSVPVIVDAAAALPPKSNLRSFIAAGADLVCFSGGKAIRGPQSSGILCGRRHLVASAALQMLDMDYLPELWRPPPEWIDPKITARGLPNHGIGRGMKVGKEEIVGLLVALERFEAADETALCQRLNRVSHYLAEQLAAIGGVQAELEHSNPAGWLVVRLHITQQHPLTAIEIAAQLEAGDPPIFVGQADARHEQLTIDPFGLQDDEVDQLIDRFNQLSADSAARAS